MAKKKSTRKKSAKTRTTNTVCTVLTDELVGLVDSARADETRSQFAARALAMLALKATTGKWPKAIPPGLLLARGQGERGPDQKARKKRAHGRGKDLRPRSDGRWKGKRKNDRENAE